MIIEETRDFELVYQIVATPSVFEGITNDAWFDVGGDIRKSHVKLIVENPENHTLLVKNEDEVLGCFIADNKGEGKFEVHTMMLPSCRGRDAVIAGKLAVEKIFERDEVKELVSYCPKSIPQTFFFARLVGFKKICDLTSGWIKNGIDWPITIVHLTKEEFLCR